MIPKPGCFRRKIKKLLLDSNPLFLVPKPLLGNALAGEVPRLPVTGDGPKLGLRVQMRSQAGAWERGMLDSNPLCDLCICSGPGYRIF